MVCNGISTHRESISIVVGAFVIALVVAYAIRVANQWDRAVILRLGRFHALKGPGLFFIIPVIDVLAYVIDTRVITSSFKAEKTLTKDTVPVNVDAVLFWKSWTRRRRPSMSPTIKAQSAGPPRPLCVMSSAKPCFRTCWKVGTRSVMSCKRSSTSAPSHGALMLFRWRSRMY